MEGDLLIFNNGSRYLVELKNNNFIIRHIDNKRIPPLFLSSLSIENKIYSATTSSLGRDIIN